MTCFSTVWVWFDHISKQPTAMRLEFKCCWTLIGAQTRWHHIFPTDPCPRETSEKSTDKTKTVLWFNEVQFKIINLAIHLMLESVPESFGYSIFWTHFSKRGLRLYIQSQVWIMSALALPVSLQSFPAYQNILHSIYSIYTPRSLVFFYTL